MSFENLGLSESLLRAVQEDGYETSTPIQEKAIPSILEGRDLMGCAQTGTGKTAAFALPTLHKMGNGQVKQGQRQRAAKNGSGNYQKRRQTPSRPIRTLVLVPTRELASQVAASFINYSRFTELRTTVVYGGVNQNPQVRALQNGVDVLVACPGRLLDLMNQGHIDISKVEMLILDEADQMLDMGFLPDLKRIVATTPKNRQTLMFSATMPNEIRRLADQWLNKPKLIQIAKVSSPVETVEQSVFFVDAKRKPKLLTHYLKTSNHERTLVFARTKHGADKIVKQLTKSGIYAAAIHGNKTQNVRARTLAKFKSQNPPILIATDIAARGLDVNGISHVINYELPEVPETYVHRIGRTGRAGASGIATSFCSGDERVRLKRIEMLTRRSIFVERDHPEANSNSNGSYKSKESKPNGEKSFQGTPQRRKPKKKSRPGKNARAALNANKGKPTTKGKPARKGKPGRKGQGHSQHSAQEHRSGQTPHPDRSQATQSKTVHLTDSKNGEKAQVSGGKTRRHKRRRRKATASSAE